MHYYYYYYYYLYSALSLQIPNALHLWHLYVELETVRGVRSYY